MSTFLLFNTVSINITYAYAQVSVIEGGGEGGRGRGEGVDDPPQCWFSVSHRLAKFQWNKEKRSKIKLKLINHDVLYSNWL